MGYLQIAMVAVIGLLLCAALTAAAIPLLHRLKTGQHIREEGPGSHLAKSGTPTMGGIPMILAAAPACVTAGSFSADFAVILLLFLGFGALGFCDDYLKVVKKQNLGLRAWQKLAAQILLGGGAGLYQILAVPGGTLVKIPIAGTYADLGIWYLPFSIFVFTAMTNAVNLTDGLDGLAAGVTAAAALFFAVVSAASGPDEGGLFCAALAGVCLGFLIFNRHPAKVFMGDTGSLALGGGLTAAAVSMDWELLLPVAGLIYVAEAASVAIQVISFRLRGKRVFKMAPLHHHFELSGMKETAVVGLFWTVTLVCCVIGLAMARI